MDSVIDYGTLMHRAMRSLIQEVLSDIAANNCELPGAHHFFITFDTLHPDVELADWLSDRYPGEMTIVMQHQFSHLEVGDEGFSVTLYFSNSPEPIYVPYDAIKTFVDPSVEFGLRFESQEEEQPDVPLKSLDQLETEADLETKSESDDKEAPKAAEVVSLDRFRK
ncbi:MAG: ClpXP protease specificity-enhancing factor SspB [Pseudomonadota bacterium]